MKKIVLGLTCGVLSVYGTAYAAPAKSTSNSAAASSLTEKSSELQKVGYSFGYIMGKSNTESVKDLDVNTFIQGFRDGYAGKPASLTEEQMKAALLEYKHRQEAQDMKAFEQQGKLNADTGAKFLAENAKKAGVTTTASGLQYEVIKQGTGKRPAATDKVSVHYEGKLIDGTVFDSSIDRGEPVTFPLNQVITGWTEGLQLMQEGGKYRFFIPAKLGYGETGAGNTIGPNSTLIFDVELLKLED